ncbi:hypothetical protein MWH28_05975 [Natroniella sulfidigena]|uniref:hypothetical protein n=1 Tax=Natroniella sulfidigena TaxID=723921 RepID=UPI00200A9EFC|nr:hypothetical protein [Natroniella sulfidigena]MCK8816921.1 hypothetical protein [Natroniella sulfidigena]
MSNRFFRFVSDIIKVIERILFRIVGVGLVLLITVQIILASPDFNFNRDLIADLPGVSLLLGESEYQFGEPAQEVFSAPEEQMRIVIQGRLDLPEAKLVVNGEVRDNFAGGVAQVSVRNGDKVIIDTRGIERGMWIRIDELSAGLYPFEIDQQFWVQDEYKNLGQVRINNQF